jgi:hypothetical protein
LNAFVDHARVAANTRSASVKFEIEFDFEFELSFASLTALLVASLAAITIRQTAPTR